MAISITIKKRKGQEYIYIIDSFRDPITKRPTTRTLHTYGNKEKLLRENPNAMQEIEARLKELQSSSPAYSQALANNLRNRISVSDEALERSNCYNIGHAVYYQIWESLGIGPYLSNATHNYGLPYDLEKTVFYGATNRILAPDSKRATALSCGSYLIDFDDVRLEHLYASLDELAKRKEALIERMNASIGKLYKRDLTLALYDVTTFYFESFVEDTVLNADGTQKKWAQMSPEERSEGGLRARGMSKEHRTQETQVVLGLLIDSEGIPITYEIFAGNTAETYTLLEVVRKFRQQYDIKEVTIVADSGLNSLFNLKELEQNGFKYIVGYPPYIRLSQKEQAMFLNEAGWQRLFDEATGDSWSYKEFNLNIHKAVKNHAGTKEKVKLDARLIGTYSLTRYHHDKWELEQKFARAKALLDKGTGAVKASNKTGYKAFIKTRAQKFEVDEGLYEKRLRWCGYMALLTNITDREPMQVYKKLRQLWRIEDNFRVMKTSLAAQPVYVWKPQHIRGHFMLNYIGLVMQRLMLRQLRERGLIVSPEDLVRALDSIKVNRLLALKKATNHLYNCTNVKDYASTLTYAQGKPLELSVLADRILKACGLEPPKALETAESLKCKLKLKMPIRGD